MAPSAGLVKSTQEFWTRRAGAVVSPDDACQAVSNIVRFFDLLAEWDCEATAATGHQEETELPAGNDDCRTVVSVPKAGEGRANT